MFENNVGYVEKYVRIALHEIGISGGYFLRTCKAPLRDETYISEVSSKVVNLTVKTEVALLSNTTLSMKFGGTFRGGTIDRVINTPVRGFVF